MKKMFLGFTAFFTISTFGNVDGLCTAKYKTTSYTGPALIDLFYKDERAYSAQDKQACLCAVADSVNAIEQTKMVMVKAVKVRWMPAKIVGGYAEYKKTKAQKYTVDELVKACN